jgi:pyruvate,orthophosphate dikinase
MATNKHVYFYGAGKAEAKGAELSKEVLGGKGVGLMEMTSIGLPVPAGFTVTIQTCAEYYKLGRKLPKGLEKEVLLALKKLEKTTKKKLGDAKDPLLVSVRSGAARSMINRLKALVPKQRIRDLHTTAIAALFRCTARPPWVSPKNRWKKCCML